MSTDLAPFPIRMSLGDICSLAAYFEIKKVAKPMDYNNINFRIGTALEPMIIQMVADNGLDMYFTGDNQLEIAHEDPYRPGHPDGLAHLGDPESLTPWLFERLPGEAIVRLLSGDMPIIEAKALNGRNFNIFMDKGLDLTNSLMRKYYGQCQEYLHTLADPKSDELWDSGQYRALLASGKPRPSWILFCAFNKADQSFGFRIIDMDTEFFEKSNSRLHLDVVQVMHDGEVPKPSHDGRGAECFWCPFKERCPAYKGLAADLLSLDDLPVTAPTDPKLLGHLDELAAQYNGNKETMALLKVEQDLLRKQMLDAIETNHQLFTMSFKVKHGTVRGRRNLDLTALRALAEKHKFELPYKTGDPSSRLYVSSLSFPDTDEGED